VHSALEATASLIRWEPLAEVENIHREIALLFYNLAPYSERELESLAFLPVAEIAKGYVARCSQELDFECAPNLPTDCEDSEKIRDQSWLLAEFSHSMQERLHDPSFSESSRSGPTTS
jgi:hypothetical protein